MLIAGATGTNRAEIIKLYYWRAQRPRVDKDRSIRRRQGYVGQERRKNAKKSPVDLRK